MDWQPIETAPEGAHVLLFWKDGEKGVGGIEAATFFRDEDGRITTLWTHGGPNSGLDWSPHNFEQPTHWMSLPPPPK